MALSISGNVWSGWREPRKAPFSIERHQYRRRVSAACVEDQFSVKPFRLRVYLRGNVLNDPVLGGNGDCVCRSHHIHVVLRVQNILAEILFRSLQRCLRRIGYRNDGKTLFFQYSG